MKSTPDLVRDCLVQAGTQALLVGGLALEAHGYGRQTYDVDCLMAAPDLGAFEKAIVAAGYQRAAQGENFRRYLPSTVYQAPVDVLLVDNDTFAAMWQAGLPWSDPSDPIRVPSLVHLLALKLHAIRNNPAREARDLADIAELLAANPGTVSETDLSAACEQYGPPGIHKRLKGFLL